ncbi:MAG: UbiA family prenyltransferase [Candidatus Hadarchaeaceae archaeon]|nr:UbiA prenyltransferase family protein [Hadesarchaea archaeon]MDH5685349.1 UbiA prenyltransferase family protein [Hadesarchaea archaeon]
MKSEGDKIQNHDMKKITKGVFWIHRPQLSVMAFLISIAGISLAGRFDLVLMLEVGLLFWFIQCIAHPINDYTDRESDKTGRPTAPIPAKLLTLKQVKIVIGLDYIIAAILILIMPLNLPVKILATIAVVHTYIFSAPPIRTNARGILASLTIASVVIVAFIGGWTSAVGWRYDLVLVLLSLHIGSTHMTAKNVADIIDMNSDKKSGRVTLPMQIGINKSFYVAAFFGTFAVFLFFLAGFFGRMNILYWVAGIVGSIITFLCLFYFQKDFGKVTGRKYFEISTLPTFIFPIAIILGFL